MKKYSMLEDIEYFEEVPTLCQKCGDKLICCGVHSGEYSDESLSDYVVRNYSFRNCENIVLIKI